MATSRNGGVHALGTFASGTLGWRARGNGGVFPSGPVVSFFGSGIVNGKARPGRVNPLGVSYADLKSRAGGVHALGLFAGAGMGPRQTSRAGGVHALGLFAGGTRAAIVPVVQNQFPAPNATIYPGDTVSFDVFDIRPLFFVEIQVDQIRREVIHDGDTFVDPYQTSVRIAIPGGWRFQVRRSGGWVAPPTFRVRAYDTSLGGG